MSQLPSFEERLRALCDVSCAITTSLAQGEVLALICSQATRLLDAESAFITVVCRGKGESVAHPYLEVTATTPDAGIEIGQPLALEGSLNGKALSEHRTLVVNEVLSDPSADRDVAQAAGLRQAVVAPLYYGEVPLGTIAVHNANHRTFDSQDAELLTALAAQAAVAIWNAQLFEKEELQLQELQALRAAQEDNLQRVRGLIRVGMALNGQVSLEELLQTLVESARDVIKARYAALGVLAESGNSLERFHFSGMDPGAVDQIGRLPTGGGTLGIMLRDARTVRLRDLQSHPNFAGFPEAHPAMHSLLGVPVRVGEQVFGNLYLTEKIGADEFSEEDEELAELLAAQAAVAIQNASLSEQRTQFLAIINHEIKNASAGVLGWTERLRSLTRSVERPVRDSADYAFRSAQQLHKLVVDFLDLSRIEARRLDLDVHAVDLRSIVREVAGTVRPTAEKRDIELRLAGFDHRSIVEADATRVRQILINLLSNAIKFSETGGQVDIELAPCDIGWSVTVHNTGPGIDPDSGDEIFRAYANRARPERSGSGLGLAISRHLARLLGGDLSLVDGGPGARFRLELPAKSVST